MSHERFHLDRPGIPDWLRGVIHEVRFSMPLKEGAAWEAEMLSLGGLHTEDAKPAISRTLLAVALKRARRGIVSREAKAAIHHAAELIRSPCQDRVRKHSHRLVCWGQCRVNRGSPETNGAASACEVASWLLSASQTGPAAAVQCLRYTNPEGLEAAAPVILRHLKEWRERRWRQD